MKRVRRKKRQILPPVQRQQMILDAALQMFSRYGYESCEVDKIAAFAGIGKGTIYRHFPTKENLFVSVIDRGYEFLDEKMKEMDEFFEAYDDSCIKLEEIITKELTLYVDFFIDNPEYYRILMIERPEIRLTLHEETIKGHRTHIGKLVDRIKAGIRAEYLVDLDPSFLAYCYLSLAGVIVERKLYGKRNTLKKDIRHAVDLLLRGVIAQ
jgi:AcrR family transcriptional regulator